MRRIAIFCFLSMLALVACGDSGDAEGGQSAPTTPAPTSAAAPTAGAPASGKVDATVADHAVQAPTTISAGTVEFAVKNAGSSEHEFVVIKGSYADQPKTTNGAVIENQLATGALVGRTARIKEGSSETKAFTLTAGKYVFLCNLVVGPTSHAGIGQRLDVTVT